MKLEIRIKLILLIPVGLYIAASIYIVYLFFSGVARPDKDWPSSINEKPNSDQKEEIDHGGQRLTPVVPQKHQLEVLTRSPLIIEVWSKVGLGSYTWEHLFGGELEPRLEGLWSYGELQIRNLHFRMRDGDGVQPDKVPKDVKNLVLVLNGRSPEQVQYTQVWLNYLDSYPKLDKVVLLLIGNEQCQNDWVLPHLKSKGGKIDALFIVYDTLIVNGNNILQWPLGAATYRGFPVIQSNQLHLAIPRRYRCNFLGTVYPGSSREQLMKVISDHNLQNYCYLKVRKSWEPDETDESLQSYISVLLESDLTLSPVGMNAECYRIYEAMALGSVPVIEDVSTKGECSEVPFRLLKRFNPPVIFIKDWSELPGIIERELAMSVEAVIERRKKLVAWYETFKSQMKDILLGKIEGLFNDDFR